MKTELSIPCSIEEIVEELLSQLTEEKGQEEETDLGRQGYARVMDYDEEEISAANGELIFHGKTDKLFHQIKQQCIRTS